MRGDNLYRFILLRVFEEFGISMDPVNRAVSGLRSHDGCFVNCRRAAYPHGCIDNRSNGLCGFHRSIHSTLCNCQRVGFPLVTPNSVVHVEHILCFNDVHAGASYQVTNRRSGTLPRRPGNFASFSRAFWPCACKC